VKKILEEDYILLNERIKVLEKQMFDLGEDFNEAVNQSSETWHDNAPFDAVRDRQSLLQFELTKLRIIRKDAVRVRKRSSNKVQIGSMVELSGIKDLKIMIGGHWIGRVEVDGYTLVSFESPVATILKNKKVGEEAELLIGKYIVRAII